MTGFIESIGSTMIGWQNDPFTMGVRVLMGPAIAAGVIAYCLAQAWLAARKKKAGK